jgi:hypothetical protein
MDKSGRSSSAEAGEVALQNANKLQGAGGMATVRLGGRSWRAAATVAQHHDKLLGRRVHRRLDGLSRLSPHTQVDQAVQRAGGADRLAVVCDFHLQVKRQRNREKERNQSALSAHVQQNLYKKTFQ